MIPRLVNLVSVMHSGYSIQIVLWGDAAARFSGTVCNISKHPELAAIIFVGATVREYSGICFAHSMTHGYRIYINL